MRDDELQRFGRGHHEGPASTSPYPTDRLAPRHDLVNMAREIEQAENVLSAVAGRELELIAAQVRHLREQAEQVLERARRSAELHRAACRFQKRAGHVYHLYRGERGLYWSLLSPSDWHGSVPDSYAGAYRLESDMSFTSVADV